MLGRRIDGLCQGIQCQTPKSYYLKWLHGIGLEAIQRKTWTFVGTFIFLLEWNCEAGQQEDQTWQWKTRRRGEAPKHEAQAQPKARDNCFEDQRHLFKKEGRWYLDYKFVRSRWLGKVKDLREPKEPYSQPTPTFSWWRWPKRRH